MKIALLCDTHVGARGDSTAILNHQERFFNDIFFPNIEQYDVDTILHLGDIFDRRKYINFNTLNRSKDFFFDKLKQKNLTMHAILGNHDTYFVTTNKVNSVKLLLSEYSDHIHIYESEPIELEFGNSKILMCPWLVKGTFESSMKIIEKSRADILLGHFDIKGFEMMKGVVCEHGIDYKKFSHFEAVYSGHFHYPSHYGNIRYLGSQYEMNWSDYGSDRGFYLLDTTTKELTFIENPYKVHHRVEYDDTELTVDEVSSLDVSNYKDCYIKVIVKNRTNSSIYDLFIEKLNDAGAADVKVVEESLVELSNISIDELLEESRDTRDILRHYVDSVETNQDKNKIKTVVEELYNEALSL